MNDKEFDHVYRKANLTNMLFLISYVFMLLPAISGVMLFIETLLYSWGEWTIYISFNHYGEWWIEFVMCIGGFLTGTVLWIIATVRWKNFK